MGGDLKPLSEISILRAMPTYEFCRWFLPCWSRNGLPLLLKTVHLGHDGSGKRMGRWYSLWIQPCPPNHWFNMDLSMTQPFYRSRLFQPTPTADLNFHPSVSLFIPYASVKTACLSGYLSFPSQCYSCRRYPMPVCLSMCSRFPVHCLPLWSAQF